MDEKHAASSRTGRPRTYPRALRPLDATYESRAFHAGPVTIKHEGDLFLVEGDSRRGLAGPTRDRGSPASERGIGPPGRRDELIDHILTPRPLLPLLVYLSQTSNPSPTAAMRQIRIGKTAWYEGIRRLQDLGLVCMADTAGRSRGRRLWLTELGRDATVLIGSLAAIVRPSDWMQARAVEDALAVGDSTRVWEAGLPWVRRSICRSQLETVEAFAAKLHRHGRKMEARWVRSHVALARGNLDEAEALCRPSTALSTLEAPTNSVVYEGWLRARCLEARGVLGQSYETLRPFLGERFAEADSGLIVDVRLSCARLKLKSGAAREACGLGLLALNHADEWRDPIGRAESLCLLTAAWTLHDRRGAAAFRDATAYQIHEARAKGPLAEYNAGLAFLAAAEGRRRSALRMLRLAEATASGVTDWPRRARIEALVNAAQEVSVPPSPPSASRLSAALIPRLKETP